MNPSKTAFEHRLRVRYGETDQMGVAHHSAYILYMEEARTRLLAHLGSAYSDFERAGLGLPVRRVNVRYRAALRFEDELLVRPKVTRLGGASVTFTYEMVRASDGELVASGITELACVRLSPGGLVPVPLPGDLRALLERAAP
ncbi:MAG: thioesterase family protein [Planctomycetota bacterium]|jgi:acyl-CoA thioester hydrolase|nr:thioesterase family protein [Planctomycetota bacterium]MDP6518752.1 thioesterase family protein [Planctomycetota bacterium]MDP6838213.1 thioesterase family protein [Planctomycetota bacterium]MDP6955430.1 thioesterase family protein [Planctomycetota bacterium]